MSASLGRRMPRHDRVAHPHAAEVRRIPTGLVALVAVLALVVMSGCRVTIPADPDHTLERVHAERVLRAGASANPPLVVVDDADRPPTGSEPELVEGFARRLGVEVEWVLGGESELVGKLEDGEVDLVVGGLLKDSPWEKRATLTRPYATTSGPDGTERRHVMAVPLGENAMLTELERYLDEAGS